ncbi:MAG: YafY family transcriptional regulator [Gammaproteobacteria bacterium]|nr:YafY family transcriptional regulator [Gammaproteobacteria bacterium]MDH5650673.1 YafY family transcriptional regulator [Gammaproteobacteria bacterium]
MRRADRLFQIIQYLRTRRITTAQWLAEQLEVSERTIYRDISDLTASGVPIEGEAGIGYVLRKGFDLPPLMFTEEELAALTLGAQIVKSWADPQLAGAAQNILSKVELVLPDALKDKLNNSRLFSPMVRLAPETAYTLAMLRQAAAANQKISFGYTRADGNTSQRTVWPLGLFFWGSVWTLAAWCELRGALRNFRIDRITAPNVTGELFETTQGRTLNDFIDNCNKGEEDNGSE